MRPWFGMSAFAAILKRHVLSPSDVEIDDLQEATEHELVYLQVHLTYVSATEITVSWATGYGNLTRNGTVDPSFFAQESGPSSTAYWGTRPGQYTRNYTANAATITRYNQVYTW